MKYQLPTIPLIIDVEYIIYRLPLTQSIPLFQRNYLGRFHYHKSRRADKRNIYSQPDYVTVCWLPNSYPCNTNRSSLTLGHFLTINTEHYSVSLIIVSQQFQFNQPINANLSHPSRKVCQITGFGENTEFHSLDTRSTMVSSNRIVLEMHSLALFLGDATLWRVKKLKHYRGRLRGTKMKDRSQAAM